MSSTPNPVHWTTFASLQECAEPYSIDQSLGREEALTEILREIVADPAISLGRARKRFANLCRNRSSKYRQRRATERDAALPLPIYSAV